MILELLRALRGKQRERVNPDQLLLFRNWRTGIDDQGGGSARRGSNHKQASQEERPRTTVNSRWTAEEIVLHELPESERLCPHDGQPMPVIRWEESKQLDFMPSKLKVIVHRRAVYACPTKHDEATIVTAPKPPEPVEKGLASLRSIGARCCQQVRRSSAWLSHGRHLRSLSHRYSSKHAL